MTRNRILTAAASAAFLTIATCSLAGAASAAPDIGSSGGIKFDKSLENGLQQDQGLGGSLAPASHEDLSIRDFINADKNHDGFLDRAEFKALASMVKNENKSLDAIAKMENFGDADANKDGKVSARELGIVGGGVG